MPAIKDNFNVEKIIHLSFLIKKTYPNFNSNKFKKLIMSSLLELELKGRVKIIADALEKTLPKDYIKALSILESILCDQVEFEDSKWEGNPASGIGGFLVWPLTQFVQDYGLNHFDASMKALYQMTKRFTAEFAIRDFITMYDNEVFDLLYTWAKDSSFHVRRLVSEGTRPRLPWARNVKNIDNNLSRNISLLELLKNDSHEYVRKSVANHLNDISKLNPELMLETCEKWKNTDDKEISKLIRYASRTLLKFGNKRALLLNGIETDPKVKVRRFELSKKKISKGECVNMLLELESISNKVQSLLIDYVLIYPGINKERTKVFRFKELQLNPKKVVELSKKLVLKDFSIRTLLPGNYQIHIKVSDCLIAKASLDLN